MGVDGTKVATIGRVLAKRAAELRHAKNGAESQGLSNDFLALEI